MTDERVETTKEWLNALIGFARVRSDSDCDWEHVHDELQAILASQPERVECRHPKERIEMLARVDTETVGITPLGHALPLSWSPICRACGADVPAVGQSLKGAGDK